MVAGKALLFVVGGVITPERLLSPYWGAVTTRVRAGERTIRGSVAKACAIASISQE